MLAVHRPEVFVTEAIVDVQPLCELPAVLKIKIEGVHNDKALRVSNRDRGRGDIAGKKIGERGG